MRPTLQERALDVLPEPGVVAKIIDGSEEILWRPLDAAPDDRPNRLERRWTLPGNLEREVVTEQRTYKVTDAEGNEVGTAEFFSASGPIPE